MKITETLDHQQDYVAKGIDPMTGEKLEYYSFMSKNFVIAKSPTKSVYYYTQIRFRMIFKIFFINIRHWIYANSLQFMIWLTKGAVEKYLKKLNFKKNGRSKSKSDRD